MMTKRNLDYLVPGISVKSVNIKIILSIVAVATYGGQVVTKDEHLYNVKEEKKYNKFWFLFH